MSEQANDNLDLAYDDVALSDTLDALVRYHADSMATWITHELELSPSDEDRRDFVTNIQRRMNYCIDAHALKKTHVQEALDADLAGEKDV